MTRRLLLPSLTLALCLLVALPPPHRAAAAALSDLKFPHHGASYCPALEACSATVKMRGTKEWFDCVALHALRAPTPPPPPPPTQSIPPPSPHPGIDQQDALRVSRNDSRLKSREMPTNPAAILPPEQAPPSNPREHPQPAVILLDCTGVGWGNRFRSLQVRQHPLPLQPLVSLFMLDFNVPCSHLWAVRSLHGGRWLKRC